MAKEVTISYGLCQTMSTKGFGSEACFIQAHSMSAVMGGE